jgi:hypothetical protein
MPMHAKNSTEISGSYTQASYLSENKSMLRAFILSILCASSLYSFGQEDWSVQQKLDSIQRWAREIEADSTVDTEVIGTGQFSAQYERYFKLISVANDDELFELTTHRSPAVRLYAYYGLTKNNPSELVVCLKLHPDDSAQVTCQNGSHTFVSTVYYEAISWAEEFLIRGNPRGLSREDKEYVHTTYLKLMQSMREKSKKEKLEKKKQN